jgi:hypothetical protein
MKAPSMSEAGYWYDPLEYIWWVYREGDPVEYGFICPHCQKRYGEKKRFINVERCPDCPPYYPGSEISWNMNKATKKRLQALGYFSGPPKGGRKKRENQDETV